MSAARLNVIFIVAKGAPIVSQGKSRIVAGVICRHLAGGQKFSSHDSLREAQCEDRIARALPLTIPQAATALLRRLKTTLVHTVPGEETKPATLFQQIPQAMCRYLDIAINEDALEFASRNVEEDFLLPRDEHTRSSPA